MPKPIKKKRRLNIRKIDPSRTGALRTRFRTEMRRRFKSLIAAVKQFLVTEDAFGLEVVHPFQPLVMHGGPGSGNFGHEGIPGHQGGSAPAGGGASDGSPVGSGPFQTVDVDEDLLGEYGFKGKISLGKMEKQLKGHISLQTLDASKVVPSEWNSMGPQEEKLEKMSKADLTKAPPIVGHPVADGKIEAINGLHRAEAAKAQGKEVRAIVLDDVALEALGGFSDTVQEAFAHYYASRNLLEPLTTHSLQANAERQVFRFQTTPTKMKSFQSWFKDQVKQKVLSTDHTGRPWTSTYVNSAYRQGVVRAYIDTHKEVLAPSQDYYLGGQSQFLRDSFAAPEAVSKIELLSTRAFDQLTGITDAMSQGISRILSSGLANGLGPMDMAREMANSISGIERTRAETIVRTEVMHAHAEGQLDSYERMGAEEIGIEAEWSTAGDSSVCKVCQPLDGVVMKIEDARGLLPRHPNCFTDPKTTILTETGPVPIEKVKVGDWVVTHRNRPRKVTQVHRTEAEAVVTISIIVNVNGIAKALRPTSEHPIYVSRTNSITRLVEGTWREAKEIRLGDVLWYLPHHMAFATPVRVIEISAHIENDVTLYNLSVDEDESYVANDLISHNCRCVFQPAIKDMPEEGQKTGKDADKAIAESIDEEGGDEKSSWAGVENAEDREQENLWPEHQTPPGNIRPGIHAPRIKRNDELQVHGGAGSGNFGHEGRPGERGGSGEGDTAKPQVHLYDGQNLVEIGRKDVLLYKNPSGEQIQEIMSAFYGEYPSAPRTEVKVRSTLDADGNKYSWMAGDATHSQMHELIKRRYGIDTDQNGYFESATTHSIHCPLCQGINSSISIDRFNHNQFRPCPICEGEGKIVHIEED